MRESLSPLPSKSWQGAEIIKIHIFLSFITQLLSEMLKFYD